MVLPVGTTMLCFLAFLEQANSRFCTAWGMREHFEKFHYSLCLISAGKSWPCNLKFCWVR
ncbi:hypothetical protein B0O99DRAFT_611401, partial [Bisporella sp. PMI_857]